MKLQGALFLLSLFFVLLSVSQAREVPQGRMMSEFLEILERVAEQVANKEFGGSACVMDYLAALKDPLQLFDLFDATGKIPDGILQGDFLSWGSYQECQALEPKDHYCVFSAKISSINQRKPNQTRAVIRRRLTAGGPPTNSSSSVSQLPAMSLGVCVPASCSESDLQAVAVFIKTVINETFDYEVQFSQEQFTCIPEYTLDTGAILVIFLISLLFALVVMSTVFDAAYPYLALSKTNEEGKALLKEDAPVEKKDEPPTRVFMLLRSFSLLYNLPRLLNTSTRGQITSLNGIRVLSICWVIIGHTYDWSAPIIKNPATQLEIAKRLSFQFISNAWFSVDSFLFLSGFLLAYLSLKELNRKGKLPWALFYFHRLWRLTPVYLFVILLFWKLNIFWTDGPSSLPMKPEADACGTYWWTNLLYINNFYPEHESNICMGASWYLAIDMQFFALSPIVLFTYYKSKIAGWILTSLVLIGSWVTTAIIFHNHNYFGNTIENFLAVGSDPFMDVVYTKPYTRVSPYLVGFITAYVYIELQERRDKQAAASAQLIVNQADEEPGCSAPAPPPPQRRDDLSIPCDPRIAAATMTSGILVMAFLNYCTYTSINYGWSSIVNVLYGTFSRFVWGIALSLVVMTCATGNGGWINTILSHHIFTVLSKLTYSTYLTHSLVMNALFYNLNQPLFYHDFVWMSFCAGAIALSFACAFVVNLMVEMPVINLEKVLLGH